LCIQNVTIYGIAQGQEGVKEVLEHRTVVHRENARNILPHHELRSQIPHHLHESQRQVSAIIVQPLAKSGHAERLAGRPADDQVNRSEGLGSVNEVGRGHVPEVGHGRKPLLE